jgi:hypothetical protein
MRLWVGGGELLCTVCSPNPTSVNSGLTLTKPRSIMATITFPGQPSSSSPHDALYPLSFENTGFQMNPESAHPPRTPRTSVTFSSQASTGHDGTEETSTELEVELEEEEEEEDSQEKSAAKNQVHPQEVWRGLLETSTGRDKAFVLHFCLSSSYSH